MSQSQKILLQLFLFCSFFLYRHFVANGHAIFHLRLLEYRSQLWHQYPSSNSDSRTDSQLPGQSDWSSKDRAGRPLLFSRRHLQLILCLDDYSSSQMQKLKDFAYASIHGRQCKKQNILNFPVQYTSTNISATNLSDFEDDNNDDRNLYGNDFYDSFSANYQRRQEHDKLREEVSGSTSPFLRYNNDSAVLELYLNMTWPVSHRK